MGIACKIYLDDVIVVACDKDTCVKHFAIVRELLADLGLPESVEKIQYPSTCVTWLGIRIDFQNMSLSVPETKLQEVRTWVGKALKCRSISRKHLQSMLGKLLHIAKCIRPARLFVARLLEGLRSMSHSYMKVNCDMKKDLQWFSEFSSQWNGVSLMPSPTPNTVIQVDASGSGIGAHNGKSAYGARICPIDDPVSSITELEAVNVVVAINTFVGVTDKGSHIMVQCDNLSSVEVFRRGRAKNKVLLECARHLWMVQALLDVTISYVHISGTDNSHADSLSRMHLSNAHKLSAYQFITSCDISYVVPCLYIFSALSPLLVSRAGICITPVQSREEAADGQSPRYSQEPPVRY